MPICNKSTLQWCNNTMVLWNIQFHREHVIVLLVRRAEDVHSQMNILHKLVFALSSWRRGAKIMNMSHSNTLDEDSVNVPRYIQYLIIIAGETHRWFWLWIVVLIFIVISQVRFGLEWQWSRYTHLIYLIKYFIYFIYLILVKYIVYIFLITIHKKSSNTLWNIPI